MFRFAIVLAVVLVSCGSDPTELADGLYSTSVSKQSDTCPVTLPPFPTDDWMISRLEDGDCALLVSNISMPPLTTKCSSGAVTWTGGSTYAGSSCSTTASLSFTVTPISSDRFSATVSIVLAQGNCFASCSQLWNVEGVRR
jgi:hypothetical protein